MKSIIAAFLLLTSVNSFASISYNCADAEGIVKLGITQTDLNEAKVSFSIKNGLAFNDLDCGYMLAEDEMVLGVCQYKESQGGQSLLNYTVDLRSLTGHAALFLANGQYDGGIINTLKCN